VEYTWAAVRREAKGRWVLMTSEFCLRAFDVCRFLAGICAIWIVIDPIPGEVFVDNGREELP
jgi:hypothetical protein